MKAQRLAIVLLLVGVVVAGCAKSHGKSWTYGKPVSAKNIFQGWSDDSCEAEAPKGKVWTEAPKVTVVGLANPWGYVTPAQNPTVKPAVISITKVDDDEEDGNKWGGFGVPAKNPTVDPEWKKDDDVVETKTWTITQPARNPTVDWDDKPVVVIKRIDDAPDNYGCAEWRQGVCTRCSVRFIARSRTCEPVNPLCATWDNTGKCTSCYKGYAVCAEGCAPATPAAGPSFDAPLCAVFDSNGKCTKCAVNAYWKHGVCRQVNPNCKTFDNSNGWCNSCYAGYALQSGACALIPLAPDTTAPADLLCARWRGNVCHKCSVNAYFNNGFCTQVNPLCQTFDSSNGACLTCYKGYAISGANCALVQVSVDNSAPSDLLCAKWHRGVCVQCAKTAFFRGGVCIQSDPLCRTFHETHGSCLSCYEGYYLDAGQCIKAVNAPDTSSPSDLLCAKWNGKICLKCSKNSFFRNGVCTAADPLCKTFDSYNGNCLSCYKGYALGAGNCVRIPDQPDNSAPADLLCAQWNGRTCEKCSFNAFFNNGACVAADPTCKTFNAGNGACTSCYVGYSLSRGQCVRDPVVIDNRAPSDLLCARWNGNVCQRCANTAFWRNGACTQSDPLCKTFNSDNGACLTCYSGYLLNDAQCVRAQEIPEAGPTDLLCARWVKGVCKACSQTAYWKAGACVQSDPLCRTFDSSNGACLSCYKGYALQANQCVRTSSEGPADLLCAKWNNGVCIQCSKTAFWSNGVCVQSNPQCSAFDNSNGWCTACYKGYVLVGGNCVVAQVISEPAGPQLPANFDIYCKTYAGGRCKACFFGYKLDDGKCVENFAQDCKVHGCH